MDGWMDGWMDDQRDGWITREESDPLVNTYLKYYVQFSMPILRMDMNKVESVKRRMPG